MFRLRRKLSKRLILAFIALIAAVPVYAEGEHGHRGNNRGNGSGHGGYRGSSWVLPALIGGAIAYDLTYPYQGYIQPYPVYAPPLVYAPPQVFIQTAPVYAQPLPIYAPPSPSVPLWYFCSASNAYYPYVTLCPSGWQAVPATPPR